MIRSLLIALTTYALVLISLTGSASAQSILFYTNAGNTSFSSKTPLEDIDAENKKTQAILNTTTGEVAIRMNMKDFSFENKLMQEHFNENYMESGKYPVASFAGKITKTIDYSQNGEYDVSATGKFTVHGVTQNRTIEGKLKIESGKILITSAFQVALADHKIEVPQIVFVKIAQNIQVKAQYALTKK